MCHGYVALLGSDDQVLHSLPSSFVYPACHKILNEKEVSLGGQNLSQFDQDFRTFSLTFVYPIMLFSLRAGVGTW